MPHARPPRDVFEHVRIEGERFEGGLLPLSATEELRKYRTLIESVARQLFMADHPGRERVSTGDLGVQHFDLAISRVTDGSASVDLVAARMGTSDTWEDSYAERARSLIEEVFVDLAVGKPVPDHFPRRSLADLAQMGRTLGKQEKMTWAKSRRRIKKSSATLTSTTTQGLEALAIDAAPAESLIMGYVTGVNSEPFEFWYKREGVDQIRKGKFLHSETFLLLREACGLPNRTPLVSLTVSAVGKNIIDVLGVEMMLPRSWSDRLERLSQLEDGWLEGRGLGVTALAIRSAEEFLFKALEGRLLRPSVFPTPEGGIQFEWPNAPEDLEVVVSGNGSIRAFHDNEDEEGFLGDVNLVFNRAQEVLSRG